MMLGIDPGLTGAVAILDAVGALVAVHDTPTLLLTVTRGTKQTYDIPGMTLLLVPYADQHARVIIEEAQAMPGQGTRSMFTCGYGYGIWCGILGALQIPYTTARPRVWKRRLGLGKDKEASRLRAQQLFPSADLRHKKDHGRAEALLLAWYGQR
jgi:crossover junction endodeoxyribonuclease RuvC